MVKILHWPLFLGPSLNQENSLQRMFFFLEKLNNPHLSLKNVIHITGTKGKGSTSVYVASILQKLGFKVGLYTSPHIHELNERIQINGEMISDRDLFLYTEELRNIAEKYNIYNEVTSFEAFTLIAINYFLKNNCDFNIIEVGMGGLLDATNIFKENPAIASVFTPIHLDHKNFLGNAIENIIGHKLGILHPGVENIIVSSQANHTLNIIKKYVNIFNELNIKNNRKKLKEYYYDTDFTCYKIDIENSNLEEKYNLENNYFIFNSKFLKNKDIIIKKPPLQGEYQMINFSVAMQTILSVSDKFKFNIAQYFHREFFSNLKIKHIARMEKITYSKLTSLFNQKSLFIMDGAHNQISAFALNREIRTLKTENQLEKVFMFMARSKGSSDEMIKVFDRTIIDKIFCTRANLEAKPEAPEFIYQIAKDYNFNCECCQSIKIAIDFIKNNNEDEGKPCLFIFTGSLYLARDIKYFFD